MIPLSPTVMAAALLGLLQLMLLPEAWDAKRFLKRVPAMRTPEDLQRFKRLAARGMYRALVGIGLSIVGGLSVGFAMYTRPLKLTWDEFGIVLGMAGVLISEGFWAKSLNTQARTLPVVNHLLLEERNRVAHTWRRRAFPDW